MSSFPNHSRHVYTPSSSSHSHTRVSMRPNLSWSTIREESSADVLSSEVDDKQDRINRLKKLERLKERRYMDYQSLKRRGSSKEYSDRFQRDCEEFNKLKYRQVHHTPSSVTISKQRSVSVSDLSSRRQNLSHSSRYGSGYSFLRGNQDDGQTLSPAGSISSIVTLDDDYMYGSHYPSEDLWRPRSRTSSFSSSTARDRLAYYGISSTHEMEDSLFDDASSEYGHSSYVPQRRAFSSCVTPRKYSGIITPTAQNADAMATYERMNQLSERLKLLQTERFQLDQRHSVDHSSSQTRSRLSSHDLTESAPASSVHSRFNQTSQTNVLPQSPTDPSIPAWSQRVNLLLSSHQQEVPYLASDTDYGRSHVGQRSRYTTDTFSRNSSEFLDSMHSTDGASIHSFHSLDRSDLQDSSCSTPASKSSVLSRSFMSQRPESTSTPLSTSTSEMRQERVTVQPPSHLSLTAGGTHFGTSPTSPIHSYQDRQQFQTRHSLHKTSITDANQNNNLEQPMNSFSKTEYSTRVFKDGQQRLIGENTSNNFSRNANQSHFITGTSPSPVSPDLQSKNFGVRDRRPFLIQHGPQESQLSSQDDVSDSGVESSSDVGRVSSSVSTDSISKFMVSASKPSESRGKAKFEISLEPSAQRERNVQSSPDSSTQHDSIETDKYISSRVSDVSRKEKTFEVEDPASTKRSTMNIEMGISQPKISDASFVSENTTLFQPDKTDPQTRRIENVASTTTIVKTVDNYSTEIKEPGIKDTTSQVTISTSKVSETVPLHREMERIEIHSKRPDEKNTNDVSEILSSTKKETLTITSKTVSDKFEPADVSERKSVRELRPEEAVQGNDSSGVMDSKNQDISDGNVVTPKKKKSKKKKSLKGGEKNVDSVSPTGDGSVSTVDASVETGFGSTGLDSEKSPQKVSISSKLVTEKESDNLQKPSEQPLLESEDGRLQTENIKSKSPQMGSVKAKTGSTKSSKLDDSVTVSKKEFQTSTNGTANLTIVKTEQLMDATRKSVEQLQSGDPNSLENGIKEVKPSPVSTKLTSTSFQGSSSVDNLPIQDSSRITGKPLVMSEDISTETEEQSFQRETIEPEYPVSDSPVKGTSPENDKTVTKKEKSKKKKKNSSKGKSAQESDTLLKESAQMITKDPIEVSPRQLDSLSAMLPGQDEVNISERTPQTGLPEKVVVTSVTKTIVSKTSELPEEYNMKSVSAELPGKRPQLTEFNQGNMSDKAAPTIKMAGSKIARGIPDECAEYKIKSFSAEFPQQQDDEVVTNVTTVTKTTSYEVESGLGHGTESITKKFQDVKPNDKVDNSDLDPYAKTFVPAETSARPQELDIPPISVEQPPETSFFGKVASTLKNTFSKVSPEMPEKSEFTVPFVADFSADSSSSVDPCENLKDQTSDITKSGVSSGIGAPSFKPVSVTQLTTQNVISQPSDSELTDQLRDHRQTKCDQGNMANKKATTINTVGYKISEKPEDYKSESVSVKFPGRDGDTITKGTTSTKKPEDQENYSVQSISAELSSPVECPQQTEFIQGDTIDKVTTTLNKVAYKTPDESQNYNTRSVSVKIPGQKTKFESGEMVTKVTTTTETICSEVDPRMPSGPQEYNVQSVTQKFPGKDQDPKLAGSYEQGDTTITTKTIDCGTSEIPEEYNLQKYSAELPGHVKVPQQTLFMQGNVADKVGTITETTGYKNAPGMSDTPEEYQPHSVSAEFPGQIKLPTQTEFTQGYLADKTASTVNIRGYKNAPGMSERPEEYQPHSVSAEFPGQIKSPTQTEFSQGYLADKTAPTVNIRGYKNAPGMSDRPEDLKAPSMSVNLPDQVPVSQEPRHEERVTKKQPQEMPTSDSPKETGFIQEGDFFGKAVITSKDVAYKKNGTDSEKPVELKGQTVSVEIPGNQLDLEKAKILLTEECTTPKTKEETPAESSKLNSKAPSATRDSFRKKSESLPESKTDSVPPETVKPPKEKQKKEKAGFLGKVATSIRSTFSKKSGDSNKPEEFPELVKESSTVDQNAANVPSDDTISYKSVVESGTILPHITTNLQKPSKDSVKKNKGTSPGEDRLSDNASAKITPEGTAVDEDVNIVKTTTITEASASRSISVEIPVTEKDVKLIESMPETALSEKVVVTSMTETTISKMSEVPEEYSLQKISAEIPGQVKAPKQTAFAQDNMDDKIKTNKKTAGSKMAPGMSERPEEYKPHSVSAEFAGQIISPIQTEFSQGYLADKTAPTVNIRGYKNAPGMSERPEEYQPHSVSAEFPGQIKSPTQTEFNQGYLADKTAPTVNIRGYKHAPGMSDRPEEYQPHSVSAEFPGQIKSPTQTEFSQGYLADKTAPTVNVHGYKHAPGMSERPEDYQPHSVSAEFHGQIKSPTQTEFSQGYLADKTAPTVNIRGYKNAPGMSERPEEYQPHSVSAEFPGQIKSPTQTEFSQGYLADKTAPTVNIRGYKNAPGMSERPEEYQPHSVSAEFPGQIKSPTQTEFSQGYLADKTAPTVNIRGYKNAPGMSDRPEEYQPHSVSAEFPGQIKSPTQTEFSQGYLADKTAPTVNVRGYKHAPGMSERPEDYQPHSVSAEFPGQIKSPTQTEFSQGYLADKTAPTVNVRGYKHAPGMSDRPEEYQPHSVSAEFPGQIKSPTQTEFSQGYLADKTAPTVNVRGYKHAPGMSDRPEEYQPHSVSAEFPGQIKSPTQTEFSQGYLADKTAPTVNIRGYKHAPGMSDRPEEYQPHSVSAEFPGQIKSPTQTEFSQGYLADKTAPTVNIRGYKNAPGMSDRPEEYQPHSVSAEFPGHIKSPTQTEFSQGYLADKVVTATVSAGYKTIPGMSEMMSEPKPVTIVKTVTNTVTKDLTDSSADLPAEVVSRIPKPETSLSQYDPKYVFSSNSTELGDNLKSSDTATVSYSSEFLTTPAELPTLTRQKSWSDIVKNGKTGDVSVEQSHPNMSSPFSIDKVEKSGDRSPRLQQTENEGRIMSEGQEAVVLTSPKMLEHAGDLSEDIVAPLKSKPVPSGKPLLRKLSGHDLLVTDIQKTSKPTLKLVAPDCTLLQTKFETDGWKPKIKSPTATMATGSTIVQTEVISQKPNDDDKSQTTVFENISISHPVAPKRRSREFRSMSEESVDGELPSPTSTLNFKTPVDTQSLSPQIPQPQVPKRKHRKSNKSNRSSVSPDPSGEKDLNVSLNLDGSRPVSHPEFRVPDPDVDVFRNSSHRPSSHPEGETQENVNSLNKSPHTSVAADSVDFESFPEIQMKSPKVSEPPPSDHTDSVFGDTPSPNNPPFEESFSSDKSRTLPLNRKKINRRSHDNNDSDNEEKLKHQLSPTSQQKRWKSAELLKINPIKPDIPPKNTGLNRVKSTSIKLLSKLQPKSKKAKSPGPTKDEGKTGGPHPDDNSGHGATREYPNLEKYPVRRRSQRRGNKPGFPTTPDSENPEEAAAHAPVAPLMIPLPLEEHDEPIKERIYLNSWDPTPLLKELYEIRLMEDDTQDLSHKFIEMEGLMEKLPMNKKKATLLKTWKRRYFRAKNGWLLYYDNRNDEKPSDEVLLMGGQIHAIGNHVIGIDDGRGRYLMVRCPSQNEYEQWLIALESQTTDNTRATYVRPSMNALKHPNKKVVMIEFGSMSIRAGILKTQATLPQLFFPNIVAISRENNLTKHVIGFDAYKPEVRHSSHLVQPLGPSDKVDKFRVDFETLPSVFTAIFQDLKIAPADYYVMIILPMNIRDEDKTILMNILMDQFKVRGVCMAPQALLALYSYNAQSGIIVDIGERLEVLPIFEGFVIDGGHTVQSFGAPKIRQSLRSGLTSENYPLYSPLEQLLVRLVMEDTCFVSRNFKDECQQYQKNPEKYKETVYLKKYNLPEETYTAISHSLSRFVSPEGLFNTDLWGMDYPTVQSLVKDAIEACPMDNRRHLCRSIYLSGGVTLLPGFAGRLEAELCKHLNESIVIQVHASPQRYHAAYVGACTLCSLPQFENSCITSGEWKTDGAKAFQKWKMTS